jgi:hypothetical protein
MRASPTIRYTTKAIRASDAGPARGPSQPARPMNALVVGAARAKPSADYMAKRGPRAKSAKQKRAPKRAPRQRPPAWLDYLHLIIAITGQTVRAKPVSKMAELARSGQFSYSHKTKRLVLVTVSESHRCDPDVTRRK